MHSLTLRQRTSKVYSRTVNSIPMNNDRSHISLNNSKVQETRVVQEKRQIDKILHGIIKQRLFSHFIDEQTRISDQNYNKITDIYRKGFFAARRKDRVKHLKNISKTIDVNPSIKLTNYKKQVKFDSTTMHYFPTSNDTSRQNSPMSAKRFFQSEARQRKQSMKLPDLERVDTLKANKVRKASAMILNHPKRLEFNEKQFTQTFRKWCGVTNPQIPTNQLKVSKETVISKFKNAIDAAIIEKFFHFFGFPQQFGLRQYGNLMETAANCSIRFIYFWMFIVLDDNSNGVLSSQQLFKFFQKFSDNDYIQEQIFLLGNFITMMQKQGQMRKQVQIPPEELLTVNGNLRMQELKDILKQSTKQRIDVNCVKNTCYHQTILSLEHDTLQRAKLNQIQNNEELTKLMKLKKKNEKKKLQNVVGLRLRDFPHIFLGKRPKIFCYVIHLLTGLRPNDYE